MILKLRYSFKGEKEEEEENLLCMNLYTRERFIKIFENLTRYRSENNFFGPSS